MAFKFVLLACILALANGSYIHGPMNSHYGPSTAQYGSQELHYTSNTGSSSQGSSSQSEIIRGHGNGQSQLTSNQQKPVQLNSGTYSLSNHGKTDVRVTNPATYSTNNYNGDRAEVSHEQQVTYAPTPSYNNNNNNNNNNHPNNNNNNGFEHSISSSSYQQSTPVYSHSNNGAGTVYGHHNLPVYQYVNSGYGLPAQSNYAHNGNGYTQTGPSSSGGHGIIGVPYSQAHAVSHMSYSSPVGISYAW